ncbi:MAG: hypothetical protein PWQ77_28 [Kosmotogales bacterium]|nr:hypothetical protein [Kosmotogales bacterium]
MLPLDNVFYLIIIYNIVDWGVVYIKASVIFHSVSGNTYLLAKELYDSLTFYDIKASIFRVEDDDLDNFYTKYDTVKEFYSEIKSIKIAKPDFLLDSDIIFFGSPTYFGNISSEMKAFMDSTGDFWPEARLKGKYIVPFTTAGTCEGGGHLCLNSINIYGFHMGMIPISLPMDILQGQLPSYGIISYSGDEGNIRPDEKTKMNIKKFVKYITEIL